MQNNKVRISPQQRYGGDNGKYFSAVSNTTVKY